MPDTMTLMNKFGYRPEVEVKEGVERFVGWYKVNAM
jgi:nucleoside-diphosphate-sugar epimerase